MKNIIFIILYISTLSVYGQAEGNNPVQTDANIFGHVLDKKTREHLPYVTIKLHSTTIGITTDASGHISCVPCPRAISGWKVSMIGIENRRSEK